MKTQCERLGNLLTRKCGVTPMEIIWLVGTVCPHKRMADYIRNGNYHCCDPSLGGIMIPCDCIRVFGVVEAER